MKWNIGAVREHTPLWSALINTSMKDYVSKILGIEYSFKNRITINRLAYLDYDEIEKLTSILSEKSPQDFAMMCERFKSDIINLQAYCDNFDFDSNLSTEELVEIFKESADKANYVLAQTLPIGYCIDPYLVNLVKSRLNNDEVFTKISVPLKETVGTKEQKGLYNLAINFSDEKLRAHVGKFGWFNMRHFRGEPFGKEHYLERINRIKYPVKEKEEFEDNLKKLKEECDKELGNIKDKELVFYVNILRELINIRTDKKDVLTYYGYKMMPLLSELGKRLGVRNDLMVYMTYEEIIHQKVPLNLEERKKGYSDNFENGITKIYLLSEHEHLLKDLPVEEKSEVVKGNPVYPGFVKGNGCVVYRKEDLGKMKEGLILVTTMTTPDYILAIEKSIGIITDEGGITSHAAIISREMKKPCIVGTKNGTI